jgi:hypothetical protein
MFRRTFLKNTSAAGLIMVMGPSKFVESLAQQEGDIEDAFLNPPPASKPQCLWFWMNGHVSRQGITLDLEAMKRIGIGGVFHFEAGTGIPKGPINYGSDEWLELKEHAISECQRLGLDYTMHNCPGWSSSGGPWISPELSMKQLTWSELIIPENHKGNISLPQPFSKQDYYHEVAVIAYPSLPGESGCRIKTARTAAGSVDVKMLTGENTGGLAIHPTDEKAWLLLELAELTEARSITFHIKAEGKIREEDRGQRRAVLLESSEDGEKFTLVASISSGVEAELEAGYKFITYDFPPVRARYFRLVSDRARRYSQVRFSGITRLPDFMEKTGNRFMFSGEGMSQIFTERYSSIPPHSCIDRKKILDLSSLLDDQGSLNWKPGPGNWTVIRFGMTTTGMTNKAAPEGGTGLECDKFDPLAIDLHFHEMMKKILPQLKSLSHGQSVGLEIDSYEAGPQTWTRNLPESFNKKNGYPISTFLPALTGRVVGEGEETERFLWDYRQTQAELIALNYYGRFAQLCKEQGFKSYIQPYDKGPFEEMQTGAKIDVTMGEYWFGLSSLLQGNKDIRRTAKLASSIAHTHDRALVGAEAFTSEPESGRWQENPFALKALGDRLFCLGVNRIVIHRFAHQPHPTAAPGMTMGPWGIHFDRTNTWFEKSRGWMQYLSRCQSLLQRGTTVADLLYLSAEEANVYTRIQPEELNPIPPKGYQYDLVNVQTLLENGRVDDNKLFLGKDRSYSMLVMQDPKRITIKLLRWLKEKIGEGLILVGAPPLGQPGLDANGEQDEAFTTLVRELWGSAEGHPFVDRKIGKGRLFWGRPLQEYLRDINLTQDLHYTTISGRHSLRWLHKKDGEKDYYFICNQGRFPEDASVFFRVKNQQPEIWNAVHGTISDVPVVEQQINGVQMPIHLDPYGSVFIVFRKKASPALVRISREGKNVLSAQEHYAVSGDKVITHDFTIAFWAKPEMNIMLEPSIHMGRLKEPWTDFYALHPFQGQQFFGKGHACCGLAIGRNGLAVWENETSPQMVMTTAIPISGWTHVALVYKNGIPNLYVQGKKIGEGKSSGKIIHAWTENKRADDETYFNGDMTAPKVFQVALSEIRIKELVNSRLDIDQGNFPEVTFMDMRKSPGLLFWKNGRYQLHAEGGTSRSLLVSSLKDPYPLGGSWKLRFPPRSGAPAMVTIPELVSLHQHADKTVSHFSGTMIYEKQWTMKPSDLGSGRKLFLDLGRVEVMAELILNGKNLGMVWTRPYRVEITDAVKAGSNSLQVRVTNLWVNRLIGDEQEPADDQFVVAGSSGFEQLAGSGVEQRIGLSIEALPDWYLQRKPKPQTRRKTFTTWKHYEASSPLVASGLLGPVMIYWALPIKL